MRFGYARPWHVVLIGIAAILMTLGSIAYVRPANCHTLCSEPEQAPCPSGSCRFGEQRAGFPFAVLRDHEAGSPTGGWGKIGPEDFPNPAAFVVDVLVYSAILWLLGWMVALWRTRGHPAAWLPAVALIATLLAGLLGMFVHDRPTAWSPPATDEPETLILGTWQAIDAAGHTILLRVYDDGRVTITMPRGWMLYGTYTWTDAATIRLAFTSTTSPSQDEPGWCADLLPVLRGVCRATIVNPGSYPAPNQGAYPIPPLPQTVFSTIDDVCTVRVDRDALTLTHASGTAQTFRRVVGT
ncbi:MAG TPA: hypothetical protein VFZ66_05965 [Herpetosiphonaceae bacterium]